MRTKGSWEKKESEQGEEMKVLQLANWAQDYWMKSYLPHCAQSSSPHQSLLQSAELEVMRWSALKREGAV
jgi:hypothetical protein